MLFNIEIAQSLSAERVIKQELFFKSMLSSFQQAISYMIEIGILNEFYDRILAIKEETTTQDWLNKYEFNAIVERFEY